MIINAIRSTTRFLLAVVLCTSVAASVLAPMASAATSYNSGIIVQPVFVQRCPSGQMCPQISLEFYGTYTVSALSGRTVVSTATAVGPGTYTLAVPAGTYTLTFSTKGYSAEPMTQSLTVGDGQNIGTYALHFIYHR